MFRCIHDSLFFSYVSAFALGNYLPAEVDSAFVLAQRGPATRPLIGRGDVGGMGASQIGRRFREELAEAAKQLNLQKANL